MSWRTGSSRVTPGCVEFWSPCIPTGHLPTTSCIGSDGSDLDLLDELLTMEPRDAGCLSGSVVGEARNMACRRCHAGVRVIAHEHVVTGLLFGPHTREREVKHAYVDNCPVCGEPWDARVLELGSFA